MTKHLINKKMPRTEEQNQEIREKTKGQILDSSLKLFSLKGYNGTSISDIANEANISKGLIYNYFKSKKDIIDTIHQNMFLEIGEIMGVVEEINDPIKKLQAVISAAIRYSVDNKEIMKLYLSLMLQHQPGTFEEIFSPEYFKNVFEEFEAIFRNIGVEKPKESAYEFAAILDGIQFHYIFMGDLYSIEEMEQHLLEKYSKKMLPH